MIRPAVRAEQPRLVPLSAAFFAEDGVATPQTAIAKNLDLMMADLRARIFVVEEAGAVMALASVSLHVGVEFGVAAEIEDLSVAPEARGRGWARRLLAVAFDWARAEGAVEVLIVITPEAEADQGLSAFYRRFGFRPVPRVAMIKRLAPE